ncbi:MAG: glutamate formimidoyltransferase [Acidobacteriota bacterium]
MEPLVECIPNFSEGRDPVVIRRVVAAAEGIEDCYVLDVHSDPDHHRSVLTMAGAAEAVLEAALRVAEAAVRWIDLRRHHGVHPRIGALDVVPFVPLGQTSMEVCVRLVERFGLIVGQSLEMPCFLYGEAARDDARAELAWVRRGGLEFLRRAIRHDPDRAPDFGPAALHETAGAVSVGARGPLIAFNLLLEPPAGLDEAREVARRIRALGGGLPAVKALGFFLPRRRRAQVSLNLVDYRQTSPAAAVTAACREAEKIGVEVGAGELVGLIPAAAVPASPEVELRLPEFRPEQILEVRWEQVSGRRLP